MKIVLNISRKMVLALVAVSVIGTAAGAITLFTHDFPTVPVTITPVLTTTCGISTTTSPLTALPNSVVYGSSGTLWFTCGTNPALTASAAGSSTPTFVLPAGYTLLAIVVHSIPTSPCPATPLPGRPSQGLTSGTAITFNSGTTWDYCANFTNAQTPGLGTFTVAWSQ